MIKKVVAVAAATGGLVLTGAGMAAADSGVQGVVSGNVVQAPVHVPVNACGNTVSVIGLVNPAFGHTCVNR